MKSAMKVVVVIVLLGVIAFFAKTNYDEYVYRNDYNSAVDAVNARQWGEAEKKLNGLLDKFGNTEKRSDIVQNLLKCYRAGANDPGLSIEAQTKFVLKVNKIAPDQLTDMETRLLKLHNSKNNK